MVSFTKGGNMAYRNGAEGSSGLEVCCPGAPAGGVVLRLRAIGMTFVLLAGCSAGADVLSRAVVHHLDALAPIGLVDPSTPITVGVVLARPNPAGEEALAEALYDPNNVQYQQFLDPGEFATAFGVSPSAFQQAVSWLQSGGLNVTPIDGTTDYVLASGNAAQVGSLFARTLSWFRTACGPIHAHTAP